MGGGEESWRKGWLERWISDLILQQALTEHLTIQQVQLPGPTATGLKQTSQKL